MAENTAEGEAGGGTSTGNDVVDDELGGPSSPLIKALQLLIRVVCIVAVSILAVLDLRTPGESISPIVYGILAGIAVGIDPSSLKGWLR